MIMRDRYDSIMPGLNQYQGLAQRAPKAANSSALEILTMDSPSDRSILISDAYSVHSPVRGPTDGIEEHRISYSNFKRAK